MVTLPAVTMTNTATRRCFVYLLRDAEGQILYVGLTGNPKRRVTHHRSQQPWGRLIASVEVAVCPSRYHAIFLEAAAIVAFKPRYNESGTQGHMLHLYLGSVLLHDGLRGTGTWRGDIDAVAAYLC